MGVKTCHPPTTSWRLWDYLYPFMHDLRVYWKINKKTTLACLHDENAHANCLLTSLLGHFVKQQVPVICLVLGQVYNIDSCAFTHEGLIDWTVIEKSQHEHDPKWTRLCDLLPTRSRRWRQFRLKCNYFKSYILVNLKAASFSSLKDFPKRSFCDGEVGDGSGGMNVICNLLELK